MKLIWATIEDRKYSFTGQISPIQSLLNGIRNSRSNNPQALPLRGDKSEKLPDWAADHHSRELNRSHHSALRKIFLRDKLLLNTDVFKGLYFFLRLFPKPTKYYYIGKANDLGRRIEKEHLKNKDFIFYSISYPQNRELYLNEVLRFYGNKSKYTHLKKEYIRESDCLLKVLFDNIAWIGCNDLAMATWKAIETHFIANELYRPCCNVSETSAEPLDVFQPAFNAVQSVLNQLLHDEK